MNAMAHAEEAEKLLYPKESLVHEPPACDLDLDLVRVLVGETAAPQSE